MGRLENIIERNKHPSRHRKGGRFPFNLVLAVFVVVILFLVIFTDLDETPDKAPAPPASTEQSGPPEKHVDGVLLYRERKSAAPRDAGVQAPR
jgi:uncharacterized lipoprotein YbaY